MIRINLLTVDRRAATKKVAFDLGQKLLAACTLILLAAALFVGWRFWELRRQSQQLDLDIAAAQDESARLRSILAEVQQFELRKGQLQQRVSLIEQLRKNQTGPVHMLDQISRSMPSMLWLTDMQQSDKAANEVLIGGRCTTMTGLSDFVSNLERSGYFQRSVEIISSQIETVGNQELIRFSIRAVFQPPAAAPAGPAAPAASAAPAPAAAPRG
jgi:type IV pilus assembly protein PilN